MLQRKLGLGKQRIPEIIGSSREERNLNQDVRSNQRLKPAFIAIWTPVFYAETNIADCPGASYTELEKLYKTAVRGGVL